MQPTLQPSRLASTVLQDITNTCSPLELPASQPSHHGVLRSRISNQRESISSKLLHHSRVKDWVQACPWWHATFRILCAWYLLAVFYYKCSEENGRPPYRLLSSGEGVEGLGRGVWRCACSYTLGTEGVPCSRHRRCGSPCFQGTKTCQGCGTRRKYYDHEGRLSSSRGIFGWQLRWCLYDGNLRSRD